MPLRRVLRRSGVIKPTGLFIDSLDRVDFPGAARNERRAAAVTRDTIDMPPSVGFALPKIFLAARKRTQLGDVVDVGFVLISVHAAHCARGRVGDPNVGLVLLAIELLDDKL